MSIKFKKKFNMLEKPNFNKLKDKHNNKNQDQEKIYKQLNKL